MSLNARFHCGSCMDRVKFTLMSAIKTVKRRLRTFLRRPRGPKLLSSTGRTRRESGAGRVALKMHTTRDIRQWILLRHEHSCSLYPMSRFSVRPSMVRSQPVTRGKSSSATVDRWVGGFAPKDVWDGGGGIGNKTVPPFYRRDGGRRLTPELLLRWVGSWLERSKLCFM